MNNKRLFLIIAILLGVSWTSSHVYALKPPHAGSITCSSCHGTTGRFRTVTSFETMCFNTTWGCHKALGTAEKKKLRTIDVSNRFKNIPRYAGYATYSTNKKQSSHGWRIPNENLAAGVRAADSGSISQPYAALTKKIYCSRCHQAHGEVGAVKKFLRVSSKGDKICLTCHAVRDVDSVKSASVAAAVNAETKHYSHPVQVSYSGAKYNKSQEMDSEGANLKWEDWFEASPTNEPGWSESARPRLYTSFDGTKKDAVVCSTCHGPLHSADSNPYTFDNLSAYNRFSQISSTAGNLLRRYPMSNPTWGDKTCAACHKVKTHQGYQCNRCHEPHKRKGDRNIYLIRTSIQTPYAKQSVYFTSTSQMAKRWGIYSSPNSSRSTAICQVCHRTKTHHRGYSTVGADREHKYLGNNKYQNCILCHPHNAAAGAFAQTGGCSTCHNAPPDDTYGRHNKHVGNAGYKWMPTPPTVANTLNETRSASDYGFSCGRCHNPWTPYTASANGRNHFGSAPGALKAYTADIGFGQGNHPLPTNGSTGSTADYVLGTRGTSETGASGTDNYRWSTPASGSGTCRNLYCHGQFYNGYTSNNPDWLNSTNPQTCGKCHGAKRSSPPGNTGGSANNWGAHRRHVGNANNQQYGFSGWKFGCNACHYPTTMSSVTSIDDRSTHVDGRLQVEFNGGGYGDANSTYAGFAEYTSRKPQFTNPFSNSKPQYRTCGLIYCHSDGSRTQGNYSVPFNAGIGTGSAKYPNWSSVRNFTTTLNVGGKTFKRRCSRCHGNSTYVGLTAAMPGVTSKGNSHTKHVIDNGFLCSDCHGGTVKGYATLSSVNLHVNKTYNINIISKYETSPGASSYSGGICQNVNCHGGQPTPTWGNTAVCQNCHMNTTGDVNKRIQPKSKFSEWTGAVPKIYSTQWADKGHGRQSGSYVGFNTNNTGANKICADCHGNNETRAGGLSTKHGTSNNPFRLFTAPDRPNILCERCHGTGGSATNSNGIFTHASSVTQAGHNYAVKCIDCHDPHGDNNIFMLHSTLPRPLNTSRDVASGRYGIITSNANQVNVDFSWSQYTSDYARKFAASKVCQVCHDETKNPSTGQSRFRYYSSLEKGHGSGRCTDCHQHSAGFKGAGCNGCHGNPPTGTFNLLSGAGRINNTKKRASGNSTTYGAHTTHISVLKAAGLSVTETCSACHYSGMWDSGSESLDIEMEFRAFIDYSGTNQEFNSGTGTKGGFYGLSGVGVGSGTDNRCQNMKCHGGGSWLTASYGTVTAPRWENTSNTAKCGKCHGAKKAAGSGSWPTSKAHEKHAGTGSAGYDLMCKLCHNQTVLGTATTLNKGNHVNAQANLAFNTADLRVSGSTAYSGDTKVNSGFGKCATVYCHSRGTDFNTPYTYANYTADWTETLAGKFANLGERCSYCHGSKGAGGYKGITSAMPNYPNGTPKINSHKKHVVDNGFSCYACHAATVDSTGRAISDKANHLNRAYDVSFPSKYDLGGAAYSANKCTNIKCHGGRTTPAWGGGVSANCQDCHYTSSGAASAEDSFTWENMSGTVAKIYSTEWTRRGHGRSSGSYPFSPNTYAGKNCTNCHDSGVSHNTGANYFRLTNSDPEVLCLSCHGTGAQLTGAFGKATSIQSHSWANVSTAGYKTGNTDGKAGWNFPNQTAKCVDCHDPHGDKNNYMVHSFVNMSGSDSQGRPLSPYAQDSVLMNFTAAKNGTQVAWSSFVKSDRSGICQRCHSAEVANFDKGASGFTSHNAGTRCTDCHKHRKAFAPSGCDSCHGDSTRQMGRASNAPPKMTASGWSDSLTNRSSLHQPHAYNPRKRPGFVNMTGFQCERCHDDSLPAGNHNTGKTGANMNNMTSTTGFGGNNKQSKINYGANKAPADDTCWNTKCHTPRAYTRTWQKPKDCDDCHGYRKEKGSQRAFNLQTTQSHKIHINYTGTTALPGSWKKNYRFACSNCHYDWQTNQNYSTHYNSFVNVTANGPINTVGADFYTRGRSFKGFTSGSESLGTCAKAYCHGNFTNGTAITVPNWKKGATAMKCSSCHTAKTAAWDAGTANNMKGRHPKHVGTAAGYNFACSVCHLRTVSNNTTISFSPYSAHVNKRKDIYFGSVTFGDVSGVHDSNNNSCQRSYCHSKGNVGGSWAVANYTADWDDTAAGKTGNKPCSYCHGDRTQSFGGITAAMPNQANQAHAKHARNVNGDSFRCFVCHANVVSSAGAIISNANHVNKFKNISIIGTYKSGQTMYSTTVALKKTCKNIRCHGGLTTPLWTATAICMNCHKGTTGDTDKRISSNNTFQSYSETVPKIYTGQWLTRGHGRPSASGNYPISGNPAANKTCTDCHGAGETRALGLSTKHGNTATNPFRLITAPDRPNVLCERCHGVGGSGAAMTGIQTHASSVTGGGGNGFSFWMKCIDCHDPHGDNNIQMLHSTIARPSAALAKKESSDSRGRLFNNATGRNVDFVNNIYTSDYAKKTTAPKVCQVCHSQTFKPNSSTRTRYRWDGSTDAGHGTTKCTSCHGHNQGFKGVKCDACHGNPPSGTFNVLSGPGRTNIIKKRFSGTTSAGAHNRHIQIFGADSNTCAFCHQGGMYNSGAENDDIDIGFKAFNLYSGRYTGRPGVRSGFYGYSSKGIISGNTARCEVQCHGQKGSWLTASYGATTAPLWENSKRTATCGKCHGAKKAAGSGSWPTTGAHVLHAGFGSGRLDYMCKLCHDSTVQGTATTLSYSYHVNSVANVAFGTSDNRADSNSTYTDSNTQVNQAVNGKCTSIYCHSKGSDLAAPYNNTADYANWTATWNDSRGSYKKASANTIAKCNYCHGNKSWTGVTSAMPNYANTSPKANAHPTHVNGYGFLCGSCHDSVVANNTSIKGGAPHVDRNYDVVYNTNTRGINNNNGGSYTYNVSGGRCENTYCHSKGTDRNEPVDLAAYAVYTAKWNIDRGSYKKAANTLAKCNFCHGNKAYSGMTSAMPNYANTSPKANRHSKHVVTYGFTCTRCHNSVTLNNSSIDASGGKGLHVNKRYNVNFNATPIDNTLGKYTLQTATPFSKCKNTYCHSRGTDFTSQFNTRTSFANFTARWGDAVGSYWQASGLKAKCNYCHGNRLFSGMTSAMPNYSTQIKPNSHKRHVVSYGFTCRGCHKYVTNNNTSIDAAGGITRHVNASYNVDFSNTLRNNTGIFRFLGLGQNNKCVNTYCHSKGTDFTRPYNTRTSFANFTARWGESLGSYSKSVGQKAKCNYCHGNRAYRGTTSAMPNYSGNVGAVKAKANSHRVHVVGNGYTCQACHYGVVPNNTSIADTARHANAFYNISFAPGLRGQAGKMYSSVWGSGNTQGTGGGTCMRVSCHGTSKPKWGDPGTANCKSCHLSASGTDIDSYGKKNDGKTARLYSSEWGQKGHGKWNRTCGDCHDGTKYGHGLETRNPFRLFTSDPDVLCLACHGNGTERSDPWGLSDASAATQNYKTHSKANMGPGDAQWSFPNNAAKCVDCHDPHGDKNKKMIHAQINYTGSDRFGRPALPPTYATVTSTATVQMTFTTPVGTNWSSFSWGSDVSRAICRRCHTPGVPGLAANMNKTQYDGNHQSHQACTNCHDHKEAFKGGGESTGNQSCSGCHSSLFSGMTTKGGYHHVLRNTDATYSSWSAFGSADMTRADRRCLMCHVDHDEFSPAVKAGRKRASNLRPNATQTTITTGVATDFWPAKRRNNPTRTDGSANYSSTFPIKGPNGSYGVCISCHKNAQTKNTTSQMEDGTRRAMTFPIGLYTSSSHNFQVKDTWFVFSSTGGKSSFRANCTKCHRTFDINQSGKQIGREKIGLHNNRRSSLLNATGDVNGNSDIQTLCYKCHSQLYKDKYDYYSSVRMSTSAKMIRTAITAKTSGHPVGENPGAHGVDEFDNATSASSPGTSGYPNYGWNRPDYNGGRHVECADCHNTHGGNAAIVRNVGSKDGNKVAGAQFGAWGIQPVYSSGAWKSGKGGRPRYVKKAQVTYQYELCMKCHSGFAYFTSAPDIPSGGVDQSVVHTGGSVYDTIAAGIKQSDVSIDFNPFNASFHPVVRKGRNQPPHNANSAWGGDATNHGGTIKYVMSSYSAPVGSPVPSQDTQFKGVSGLGWTFVPPFDQKSLLACSDCHQADNSGNAVGDFATSGFTSGQDGASWTWTYAPGHTNDKVYALSVKDSGAGNAYVAGTVAENTLEYNPAITDPGGSPSITKVEVAIVAKSATGTTNNRKITVKPMNGGTAGTASTITLGTSYARVAFDITGETTLCASWTWTCADQISVDVYNATTVAKYVDWGGLAVTYPAAGDLRGPHGSLEKWMLQDVDPNVLFDADEGGTLQRTAAGCTPGTTCDNLNKQIYTTNKRVFCVNCHRADVYWGTGPAKDTRSRLSHPAAGNANHWDDAGADTVWGNTCMMCHGGKGSYAKKITAASEIKAKGGIHGIYGTNTLWGPFVGRPSGSFKVFNRPVGVRLLMGGTSIVAADASGVYCYTNKTADGTGSCTSEAGAMLGDSYSTGYGNTAGVNYSYVGY